MTASGPERRYRNVRFPVASEGKAEVLATFAKWRSWPKPDSLSVLVSECTERGCRLLRFDAREPDHLAPLFRFISDVFAKVGARACKQHSTA